MRLSLERIGKRLDWLPLVSMPLRILAVHLAPGLAQNRGVPVDPDNEPIEVDGLMLPSCIAVSPVHGNVYLNSVGLAKFFCGLIFRRP